MEFPSSKIPVLFKNMRRLKQATLPFEALKENTRHEPSLFTSEAINDHIIEVLPINSENTQAVEMVDMENIKSEKDCLNKNKTEIKAEKLFGVEGKDNVKIKETEINNKQDINSTILMESCETINCNLNKLNEGNISEPDVNFMNNKRKLESNQPSKEHKPPKRAKLIYHVDKIKKCDDNVSTSMVEVKYLQPVNMDYVEHVDVKLNEEVLEGNFQPNSLHEKLEVNSLERKCNTECLHPCGKAISKEMEVVLTDIVKKDCTTPDSKGNSLHSEKSCAKKLTPKQLQRKNELTKRKENMLQEKEKKKKEKEEEKVRIRQEKEECKRKIREEKERKRQAEIELKSEEKRRKEAERRKKEEQKQEDKRRKEEQKLEDKRKREELLKKKEEEEELIKKKITKEAEAFSSFFTKYDVKIPATKEDSSSSTEIIFMPFTIKADMRLAPVNRNPMDSERLSRFEELYNAQSDILTYLQELRSGARVPQRRGNTWPLEEKYEDLVVLDEGLDLENEVAAVPKKTFSDRRPKLLQFYENRRPPYWGTWRKKSKVVRPKNPLGRDEIFEYDIDSDDEWEEEEPGESLRGSDDEKESEDEYEVDNEFFVPHGYLSDDENPEEEIISPETQKAKLKLLGEQFDMERNEKTKLLKPITLGCIWFNNQSDEPDNVNPSIVKFLNKRKAVPWINSIPILLTAEENLDSNDISVGENDTSSSNKKATFPAAAIPDLITFIHGNTNSRKNLAKTFLLHWMKKEEDKIAENEDNNTLNLSQARILKKIKELANWVEFPEEGPCFGKRCWYVKRDIREKFGITNLVVNIKGEVSEGKELDGFKKNSPSLITKFTKVLTEDERKNQMKKCCFRRKSVPIANSSIEKTPNSSKSQFKAMKCVRKLKDFWAKPSIHENCSERVSIPSGTTNEDGVGVSSQHEENVASC